MGQSKNTNEIPVIKMAGRAGGKQPIARLRLRRRGLNELENEIESVLEMAAKQGLKITEVRGSLVCY